MTSSALVAESTSGGEGEFALTAAFIAGVSGGQLTGIQERDGTE